jgi:hypothetical protein
MRPPEFIEVVCALCGREGSYMEPRAGAEIHPPDFDTRPGEFVRSTVTEWIQRCPHCGYAAPEVDKAHPAAAEIVRSHEYQERLASPGLPEDARRFAAHSFLLERLGQFADAGWTMLHAAWVCDDVPDDGAARRCRMEAISLWRRGKAAGQKFMDDYGQEFALAADVLRRAGEFDAARETCLEGLALEKVAPLVEDLLRRQLTLIQQRDASAHSMAELPQRRRGRRVRLE